jgi:phosphohistidine phosphatase
MELFLVRHATAEPRGDDAAEEAESDAGSESADASRSLTDRGRERFSAELRGLRVLDVQLDLILHSPFLRAVQTAEMLASLLAGDGESEVSALLAGPPREALLQRLAAAGRDGHDRVAVVGHQPFLGELCAILVHGSSDPAERYEFKKGGVAWLEGEPRPAGMTLRALLPPRLLRRASR